MQGKSKHYKLKILPCLHILKQIKFTVKSVIFLNVYLQLSLRVLNQLRQNMRRRPICPLPEDSTDYYTVHEGACECNKLHEGKHTRYLNDYISNSVSCGEEEYFMKCYNPGNFRKAVDSQNLSTFDDGTKNSKEYLSYIDSRNSRNELFGDTQYNPLKDSVDTYCWNCSYSSNSPELKSMFLCLHSHRYKVKHIISIHNGVNFNIL